MKVVNIHEAKTTLSQLLESVIAETEVIISKAGKPLVEKKPRVPGSWSGRVKMSEDFDDPLPPEILAGFSGSD